MAAFLVVFLTAMAIAYATVALATVNVWRLASGGESRREDRPERVAPGPVGETRSRCSGSAHRSPAGVRARCSHRRHH